MIRPVIQRVAVCCVVLASAVAPGMLGAQRFTTTAVRFPGLDPEPSWWFFFGDTLIGTADTGSAAVTTIIRAFSTVRGAELWSRALESGHARRPIDRRVRPDYLRGRLYVGAGPLHLVDVSAGAVRWSKSCADVGFIVPSLLSAVGTDRLIVVGNLECKNVGGFWRELSIRNAILQNLREPRVMLLDAADGRIVWSYATAPRFYHLGRGPELVDFSYWKLARPAGAGPGAADSSESEQLVLGGDRLESVRLSTGSVIWRSDSSIGETISMLGGIAFVIKDKTLTAYDSDSGRAAWTLPLDAERVSLYTTTDIAAEDSVQLGGEDIIVSTYKTASRVDRRTGTARWSIPRQDAWWQFTQAWFYVQRDDSVIAYTRDTGVRVWGLRGRERLRAVAQAPAGEDTVVVFAHRGKYDAGAGQYKGPFRFWGVSLRTGATRWTRDTVAGKPITFWAQVHNGQLRLGGERVPTYININIADGSPATAPAEAANERYVTYRRDDETLRCQDYAGTVIWQRREPVSKNADYRVVRDLGYVLWPSAKRVETIALGDGRTLATIAAPANPYVYANRSGTAFVVPARDSATIVHVEP